MASPVRDASVWASKALPSLPRIPAVSLNHSRWPAPLENLRHGRPRPLHPCRASLLSVYDRALPEVALA
eukprot:6960957-Pyramimonas_sp.AAC.1